MKAYSFGIVGLGLIGGSLAKALKKHYPSSYVVAYDQDELSLQQALDEGVIDAYTTDLTHENNSFHLCDVIFLCLPVEHNIKTIQQLNNVVKKSCILTDVGSTKSDIMDALETLDLHCTFIGGHPMTGSEKSGYAASKSYLFENAYYILCSNSQTLKEDMDTLLSVIKKIGALAITMDADHHDYVTASISHVPHVIVSLLVNLVKELDDEQHHMHRLAAGGFKDFTRIASSSPLMWQQICFSNKEKIISILDHFKESMEEFKRALEVCDNDKIYTSFDTGKVYRNSFEEIRLNPLLKTYSIKLDVEDKPGIIAEVATVLSNHHINIKNIGIINNREHETGILEICFYDLESKNNSIYLLEQLNYNIYTK